VVSWVHPCNHSALIVLLYRQILPNTHHGVRSFLSHVIMISHVTLCIHSILLSRRMSPLIMSEARFGLEVSYQWKLSASTWNLVKISSVQGIRWNYQTKRIDRWMQHRWKSTTCPRRLRRRSCMGDRNFFLLPTVPISPFLLNQEILHHFLCTPPFVNLGTRFLLRGRAVTPRIMAFLITIISILIMHRTKGKFDLISK
jgi:hypothetical protein